MPQFCNAAGQCWSYWSSGPHFEQQVEDEAGVEISLPFNPLCRT